MYGYEEYVPLNEEEILKRLNQEDIIEMALGYKPVSYQRMVNPLKKKDSQPGAWFEWFNGKFFFIDFGDNPTHRITFRFIADFYNVNFYEALRIVNNHFQLGLGEGAAVAAKPIIYHNTALQYNKKKEQTTISYKPRAFTIRDKPYWYKYGITRAQLMEDEVVAGVWYKMFSRVTETWNTIRPYDNFYIFTEFKNGHVKILRPSAGKSSYKWTSNCNENDIFAYSKLPQRGPICIIQKSYKDARVIRNEGFPAIGFQNEGCIPKDEIILDLISRFDSLPVWFDNDETGIKAAQKIVTHINNFKTGIAYPLHLPLHLSTVGITDPSDLFHKKSKAELQQFLRENNLYDTLHHP